MLLRSVAYLLWNYDRNQFELVLNVVILLNRRMPNCTTVVQTAGAFFEPEIGLNSPKK